VQGIRSMLYRIFMAEYKGDDNAFENIKTELEKLHNYNLTY
jgi:hypothetical protein